MKVILYEFATESDCLAWTDRAPTKRLCSTPDGSMYRSWSVGENLATPSITGDERRGMAVYVEGDTLRECCKQLDAAHAFDLGTAFGSS